MKYALMSMMMGNDIKVTKPTFLHKLMAKNMGFEFGKETTLDEFKAFFESKGVPLKIGDMSFEDFVRFGKENGFQSVEMMDFHFEPSGAEARKILEKYDMTLNCVLIIIDFADADTDEKFAEALDSVKAVIDKAADADCKTVLVDPVTMSIAPHISREEAYENIIKGLAACLDYAGTKGIDIAIEAIHSVGIPYCSIAEIRRVLDALPKLKYTHDTGNMLPMLENPVIAYDKLKDRVTALHLKDFIMADQGRGYLCANGKYLVAVPYGEGIVDHKSLFERLVKDKFTGYIAPEGTGHFNDGKANAIEALAYFKKLEEEVKAL